MTMLVSPEADRNNRRQSLAAGGMVALAICAAGWFFPLVLIALVLSPVSYWLVRRTTRRRWLAAHRPFPSAWREVLDAHVRFYQRLDEAGQERFRQLVSVFLDEVRITGVRTDVDDVIRVLVAASAVIPIFGFHGWEYHRLEEVLVYPGTFDSNYHTNHPDEANILGLAGLGHLRGTVILSKPSLLAGFSRASGPDNVGVHEFAHLVEQEEADGALPPEVPVEVVRAWVEYVGRELKHPSHRRDVSDYAYTNEHEYFAVLSEYFFGAPERLRSRDPALYDLLRRLFHQDPAIEPAADSAPAR